MALLCSALVTAAAQSPSFDDIAARAAAARTANDIPGAIELYRQGVAVNPRWGEGWWYLGTLLYDSDQYAAARDALTNAVKLAPNASPAWGLLGLSEFETGAYQPALEHIQRALEDAASEPLEMSAVLRYHEALLLTRAGDFDAAMQRYASLSRNAKPGPELLAAIGLAALRVAMLPRQIPADHRELYVTSGRAAYCIMAGDYAAADDSFRDLMSRFPNEPGVHYLHGTYLLASAPEHAIAELKRELQIAPTNAAAAGTLAWALLNRGDTASALGYGQLAAKGLPSWPTAQYVLGRALAETGATGQGIEHLEHAAKLDPANLEVHLALASAYSNAGRTPEARAERAQAVALAKGTGAVPKP
ncbi:MAG TPA: tetratricopeptide repeat protein [Bryobacteraceae bacterium]|nr:tetratricopeptide repeat protein [Bryobacteraceae bacterium]